MEDDGEDEDREGEVDITQMEVGEIAGSNVRIAVKGVVIAYYGDDDGGDHRQEEETSPESECDLEVDLFRELRTGERDCDGCEDGQVDIVRRRADVHMGGEGI